MSNRYLVDADYYENSEHYLDVPISLIKDLPYRKEILSVQVLCEMIESGDLILDPDWQRNFVWKKDQMTSFIESMLLGFPIQPLYLHLNSDGKYVTVDGRQRLSTLFLFYSNKLPFRKFEFLRELDFLEPLEIPGSIYKKIMRFNLDCVIFEKVIPPSVIYRFFERINTSGTPLSAMEIRNCIYQGPGTRFLSDLSELEIFKVATSNGFRPTRMRDREAILRFIGIHYFPKLLESYSSMSKFLDQTILRLNDLPDRQLKKIQNEFQSALSLSFEIFGKDNFRKITHGRRGTINMALFESILTHLANNPIVSDQKKEKLYLKYASLFEIEEFQESISRRSYEKDMIDLRIKIISKYLK